MITFVLDTFENIVGKGENAGNQHLIPLPQCFQKVFYLGVQATESSSELVIRMQKIDQFQKVSAKS